MKVVYLLGSLNRGGTETLLLNTLHNISTINIESILIYRKGGALENDFKNLGIPVFHIRPKHPLDILYLWKLRQLLRSLDCDIVHAQQPIDAFYAYLVSIGTKLKISLTFHGYDYNDSRIAKCILRFIIHKTHINIFVSDHVKLYYTDKYKLNNNCITLYNGIVVKKEIKGDEMNLRTFYDINNDSIILGMVGNFVSGRDHITICRFLNILRKQGIVFVFFFIGAKSGKDPYYFDNCYNYCQNNDLLDIVHFIGSRNDVPYIISQFDAFIYSSEHDTFGMAVVEAMMLGIPTFVNDWDVMKEITENGMLAYIYKSKNEFDLLEKFQIYLSNKFEVDSLFQQRVKYIYGKYSIHAHLLNLIYIYKDLNQKNA